MSGRNTSSETARRLVLLGEFERVRAARRHQHLEALVAREIDQDAAVVRVVLDDQQDRDRPAGCRARSSGICFDRALRQRRAACQRRHVQRHGLAAVRAAALDGPDIVDRQIERERAADAGRAAQLDFAAEQVRQFAADGEAEAGAAIFAAGAGIGLLERLEDDLLLLRRNADAGIGHFEGNHLCAWLQHRVRRASSRLAPADTFSCTPPLGGELERVGKQVLQHLLQALGVGDDAAAEVGIELTSNDSCRVSASCRNGRADRFEQVGEEDLLGLDGDGAGFDLRQVENVADQIEQVGAGAVDGAGELDLLRREVAVRIVGELLAENQDAVERRAQLVRHVGQEFRLVFRGERELGGLFFQRAAGLLDFLVLAFHFDVVLGELLRLLLELFVGLLQFRLLRLQLAGQLLRLLEQAFGLHRRFDGVEHDADAGRQLLEEGDLQRREGVDRGQLDDRLDLVFEQAPAAR